MQSWSGHNEWAPQRHTTASKREQVGIPGLTDSVEATTNIVRPIEWRHVSLSIGIKRPATQRIRRGRRWLACVFGSADCQNRLGNLKLRFFQIDTRGFEFSTSTYSHKNNGKKNIISFFIEIQKWYSSTSNPINSMNIYCLLLSFDLKWVTN